MAPETWERIGELLYDGWQPRAVLRAVELSESKLSSLTQYARKFRHRRVIAPVSRLREQLAGGLEQLGEGYLRILQMAVEQGLTDDKKVLRTAQMLGDCADRVERMAQAAEQREAIEGEAESKQQVVDPAEIVRKVLAEYGVAEKREEATERPLTNDGRSASQSGKAASFVKGDEAETQTQV